MLLKHIKSSFALADNPHRQCVRNSNEGIICLNVVYLIQQWRHCYHDSICSLNSELLKFRHFRTKKFMFLT